MNKMSCKDQDSIILNFSTLRRVLVLFFSILIVTSAMLPVLAAMHSTDSSIEMLMEDRKAPIKGSTADSARTLPAPLAAVASDDPFEPNDEWGASLEIHIGSRLENLAASGNDEDWFYCRMDTVWAIGYTLMVEIQYDPSETNFDIEVGDFTTAQPLIRGTSTGSVDAIRLEIPYKVSPTVRYYTRIHVAPEVLSDPAYNSSQLYTYNLSLFIEDGFGNTFYGYNNDTAHAADIPSPSVENPTNIYDQLALSNLIRVNDTFKFLAWETNEVNITIGGDMPGGSLFEVNDTMAADEGLIATIMLPNTTQISSQLWTEANQTNPASLTFTANESGYYYAHFTFNASSVIGQALYNFTLEIDDSIDGVGHTGSSYNTAPTLRKGLAFDGIDDRVIVMDSPNLRLGASMTIELWLKTSIVPYDFALLVGKGVTSRNYALWIAPTSGKIHWQIYSAGNFNIYVNGNTKVTDGAWHHVCVTYNGSIMAIYIDGNLDASAPFSQTPPTSAAPLTLGSAGIHAFYEGFLDEVRIIGWPLTAAMIRADYISSPKYPERAGTVAWYQFKENSGPIIGDSSENGNNGTTDGGLSLAFSETASGLWTSSPHPDYYNISLHENEILDFSVNFIHAMGDINLYLYNDSGMTEILMGSTSQTDQERINSFRSPRDATYYLFINSSIPGQRYYNLSFTIHSDDIFEENDDFLDPALLPSRNSTYSLFLDKTESDFFKIDLGFNDFLNVTISFNGSDSNLDLILYDAGSTEILVTSNHSSGNREVVTYTSPSDKSVLFKIYASSGDSIGSTAIDYQLIIAIVYNDDQFENNDELESAYLIGEGIFSRLLVSEGDPDYYIIYLLENEPLRVDVYYEYDEGNIDLWILNASGNAIDKQENLNDTETSTLIAPRAGIYYIHVYLASGIVNLYDLVIAYTERADGYEDNDSPEDATIIESGAYECVVRLGDLDYYNL
ncbi:MAG: LamG domain-containing protein, partial [Candidatus Hodarchaeota archaeon]